VAWGDYDNDGNLDILLTGHQHNFQRWKPLDASGAQNSDGITEIVDGAGGHPFGYFTRTDSRLASGIDRCRNGIVDRDLYLLMSAVSRHVGNAPLALTAALIAAAPAPALAWGGLAFGVIRGQANAWADPAAWIALAIGVVSLVLFPILMARRPNPLVPLELFRSRAFATVNLATFFIYGALYVTFFYQAVILQGVLGYTALAAGIIGVPTGILLSVLSTRVGAVAGRIGARRFLIAGPLLMAAAALWFVRLPADSAPWKATFSDPASLVPPVDVLIDVLPYTIVFGIGISLVVVIAYFELTVAVQTIYSRTFQTIPLLIVAALWYLALTSVLSVGQMFIERRFGRGFAIGDR
jgi:hypothetical protein